MTNVNNIRRLHPVKAEQPHLPMYDWAGEELDDVIVAPLTRLEWAMVHGALVKASRATVEGPGNAAALELAEQIKQMVRNRSVNGGSHEA